MITLDKIPSFYKVTVNELELAFYAKAIITFPIPYSNTFHASSVFIAINLKTLSPL